MNGFIYVMTNPTMPGLAKVGMTTRDPSFRKDELSKATGVATPFTIVFIQPVKNCIAAESWVHETLELAGARHSLNREFFNAPLHEIVRVVANSSEVGADDQSSVLSSELVNESDGTSLKELGDKYLLGQGAVISASKALRYYKLALEAECWEALPAASSLLRGKYGLKPDPETELNLIESATRSGQWWFFPLAAELFSGLGQFDSAEDNWIQYFNNAIRFYQNLEQEDQTANAEAIKSEAANVALDVLHFACRGDVDLEDEDRGWWKIIGLLGNDIIAAMETRHYSFDEEEAATKKIIISGHVLVAMVKLEAYLENLNNQ